MKVALVGAGRMGRKYINVISNLRHDFVGCVDLSAQSLLEAKKEHNLSESLLFYRLEILLSQILPDCLIIATTADSHCALTCLAAESGIKYILVEKPLAVSLEECDRMSSICDKYGAKLSVNHQMRFMEQQTKESLN